MLLGWNHPSVLNERPLHSERGIVRWAVADVGIGDPYFSEEGGVIVTIISDCYIHILENFLRPQLEHFQFEESSVWFRQDEDPAYTARRSLQVLKEMFKVRLISLPLNVGGPAQSPDLAYCDFFFLRNYLNHESLLSITNSLTPLRFLRSGYGNLRNRIQKYLDNESQNFGEYNL